MLNRACIALLHALLFALTGQAWAARPLITDDARIVDPKACQIESWVQSFKTKGTDAWALPGCNPFGFAEFTLGGAHGDNPEGEDRRTLWQIKTVIRPLQTNGWAWGIAVGNLSIRPSDAIARSSQLYLNFPISASFRDDRFIVHLNVGGKHSKGDTGSFDPTWGLGTEITLTERTVLIAETYGEKGVNIQGQMGLRYWIIRDRIQVDATLGSDLEGQISRGRWVSIGLRLLSPPFLP